MAFENQPNVDTTTDFHKVRATAMQQFEKVGFPTRKDEDWKYTSLKNFIKTDYTLFPEIQKEEVDLSKIRKFLLKGIDSYKIVFINGIFNSFLSETTHDGMDICLLSAAIEKTKYKIHFEHYFNSIASKEEGLTALNTAFTTGGAYIHIKKNILLDKPIQIYYFTTDTGDNVMLQPRNLVIVDENSQVKIVERHQSLSNTRVATNTVTEIFANTRAQVDYYKIQNDNKKATIIDSTFIQQKDNSVVAINTYSFGGKLTRNNLTFYQDGAYCNSILNGITMIDAKQHVDNQTKVYHNQPNSESHELYKGIYDGKSTGVFNGQVIVDKIAQKTNAYQQNDTILLTDDATINSKPQLEIFADDVACSHGCTIGQLDKDAMFYMKQRGIPEKEAKGLLLYAFTNEVVKQIKIPVLKALITKITSEKLGVDLGMDL